VQSKMRSDASPGTLNGCKPPYSVPCISDIVLLSVALSRYSWNVRSLFDL
jgi:hypothetical protein